MPADGGEPREIISGTGAWARVLEWTPDSKKIVFSRNNGSVADLWQIPAGGGEPVKIAQGMALLRNLRIHPDGQRVAFNAGRSKAEIWVMENFLPALSVKQ